ncbi:hypothetical protein BEH94_01760 [Candidatus Altiarchaeales archaeon WOR_SM1_SCG]|nr:hypothetical protein BEH94_01760 [Candidatus Altiarchaeales archaeon WOR_SM1_SCG]
MFPPGGEPPQQIHPKLDPPKPLLKCPLLCGCNQSIYALIINAGGNRNDVNFSRKTSEAMNRTLSIGGANVTFLHPNGNGNTLNNKTNIQKAIDEIKKKIKCGDRFLLYIHGHGRSDGRGIQFYDKNGDRRIINGKRHTLNGSELCAMLANLTPCTKNITCHNVTSYDCNESNKTCHLSIIIASCYAGINFNAGTNKINGSGRCVVGSANDTISHRGIYTQGFIKDLMNKSADTNNDTCVSDEEAHESGYNKTRTRILELKKKWEEWCNDHSGNPHFCTFNFNNNDKCWHLRYWWGGILKDKRLGNQTPWKECDECNCTCPCPNITKIPDDYYIQPGDTILYTISITNQRSTGLVDVSVIDTLPPGFSYTVDPITTSGCAVSRTGNRFNVSDIPPEGACIFNYAVDVPNIACACSNPVTTCGGVPECENPYMTCDFGPEYGPCLPCGEHVNEAVLNATDNETGTTYTPSDTSTVKYVCRKKGLPSFTMVDMLIVLVISTFIFTVITRRKQKSKPA